MKIKSQLQKLTPPIENESYALPFHRCHNAV